MKTVFIRAIESLVEDKASAVLTAVKGSSASRFELDVATFAQVPQSPFAYWVGDALRSIFAKPRVLAFDAKCGMGTLDDFRFLRLGWEVSTTNRNALWPPFAKGGAFSSFYSDIYLTVDWAFSGSELKTFVEAKVGSASRKIQATSYYFRPGLTWPRRTQGGLSLRVMPRGCIFADKGPAAFVEHDEPATLLALAAVSNSRAFAALVETQMAFGSYEVGVIQRTPIPDLSAADRTQLARLAHQSWALKRNLDTCTENSHAFFLPALLQGGGDKLSSRALAWGKRTLDAQNELQRLQGEIDDHTYRLYGISPAERQRMERGFGSADAGEELDAEETDADEADTLDVGAGTLVAMLLSWSVGVTFGRFDVRLSTRERLSPPEPDPFDPLPICSPGMLSTADGLPAETAPPGYPVSFPTHGILVDDAGHPLDLTGAIRSVFDAIFDDANAVWHEAAAQLGTPDLRQWFAHEFFEQHVKRYSRSRRKAPIYWQLSTPSCSYSVWLYVHRATPDTLFRVLNDFVGPKLDHETAKLATMTQDAGANPSAMQRRELDRQDTFVMELQGLKAEVARVAPLWRPDLDDGVVLNFAPLWRLVPQSRGWQTECKRAWEKLVSGDYDWAHLAMHLWPERVVPKCIDDRSLAIAHGVEDVFWYEDEAGAWQKRNVEESVLGKLVTQRTSSTIKAALKDLLSAPTATGGSGAKTKGARPAARKTAARASAARSAQAAAPSVDDATLRSVSDAISNVAGGASKADVIGATGLSESDWNKAIAVLLERGEVSATGQKRGTRYHASARGKGA